MAILWNLSTAIILISSDTTDNLWSACGHCAVLGRTQERWRSVMWSGDHLLVALLWIILYWILTSQLPNQNYSNTASNWGLNRNCYITASLTAAHAPNPRRLCQNYIHQTSISEDINIHLNHSGEIIRSKNIFNGFPRFFALIISFVVSSFQHKLFGSKVSNDKLSKNALYLNGIIAFCILRARGGGRRTQQQRPACRSDIRQWKCFRVKVEKIFEWVGKYLSYRRRDADIGADKCRVWGHRRATRILIY